MIKNKSAGGRNRTADTRIFSPLLYRLSYPGRRENLYSIKKNSTFQSLIRTFSTCFRQTVSAILN